MPAYFVVEYALFWLNWSVNYKNECTKKLHCKICCTLNVRCRVCHDHYEMSRAG